MVHFLQGNSNSDLPLSSDNKFPTLIFISVNSLSVTKFIKNKKLSPGGFFLY
jgi:hypothetical protein